MTQGYYKQFGNKTVTIQKNSHATIQMTIFKDDHNMLIQKSIAMRCQQS